MKLRTWHIEGLVVASALAGALVAFGKAGDWREWVAAMGVQLGFHHASVADRLREAEELRLRDHAQEILHRSRRLAAEVEQGVTEFIHHVECVPWLDRYWVGKEIAWVAYFIANGAVSPLIGCAVFILHPIWRRAYRAYKSRTR